MRYLTEKLHQRIPHSKIIWYDSMTKNGDIRWQNTLNDMNSDFFNATDGIFTNYCWKADTPAAAYEKAKEMGRQSNEVYMGLDVWGRGSFASGFETWKVSTDTVQHQHITHNSQVPISFREFKRHQSSICRLLSLALLGHTSFWEQRTFLSTIPCYGMAACHLNTLCLDKMRLLVSRVRRHTIPYVC